MPILLGAVNQQTVSGTLTEYSIWGTAAEGTLEADQDGSVVLGTKFRTNTAGVIRGIRFQAESGLNNFGTPFGGVTTVALYQGTTQLGSATGTALITPNGWHRRDFATPISVSASTIYTACALYNATANTSGGYRATGSFFASAGLTNGPLEAVANSVSSNGVFVYSTTMANPTNTYQSGCYFIDVVFAA